MSFFQELKEFTKGNGYELDTSIEAMISIPVKNAAPTKTIEIPVMFLELNSGKL